MSYLSELFTIKADLIHLMGSIELPKLNFRNTLVTIIHVWPVNELHH